MKWSQNIPPFCFLACTTGESAHPVFPQGSVLCLCFSSLASEKRQAGTPLDSVNTTKQRFGRSTLEKVSGAHVAVAKQVACPGRAGLFWKITPETMRSYQKCLLQSISPCMHRRTQSMRRAWLIYDDLRSVYTYIYIYISRRVYLRMWVF